MELMEEEEFMYRLREMLERENPCGLCPGADKFNPGNPPQGACDICNEIMEVPGSRYVQCPCYYHGEKAIALAQKKVDEYFG